jgi:hypothetical protein
LARLNWRDNQFVIPILWFALFQTAQVLPPHGIECGSGSPLIIERHMLKGIGKPRELVLWMCGAEKHEDDFDPEAYTCPDQTTGHFYRGRTQVSLVDLQSDHVVNTVPVLTSWSKEQTFDVPYKIAPFFYHVDGPRNKNGEGKPRLLWLKDYNGDGEALEFALFDANNCTIVETTLFGYSKSQDHVIQYPIHLLQREGTTVVQRNSPWLDHLMLEKPIAPGYWKWQYQYHAGGLTHYEIKYNPSKEMFEGEIVIDPARDSGGSKK